MGIHQLPDGAGSAPARGFPLTITQTQRPAEIGTPDGNRTHISRTVSSRSIAVELRGGQMGKWRDRTEALHAGNRTRTAKAFATDGTPSLCWRITDQLRPIEIGVTNRIRTGTNAFTGRDAAVTSWPPSKWRSHVDLHHEPPPSQSGVQNLLHLESKWRPWPDSHRLGSG